MTCTCSVPGREVARVDGLVQVAAVEVGVGAGDRLGLVVGQALTPWLDLKWYLTQKRSPAALIHW